MNKSVNHARNIVIGPKGQMKSLKSAGTIGRQKHPLMSLMTVMNNLLDLTPAVVRTIILPEVLNNPIVMALLIIQG